MTVSDNRIPSAVVSCISPSFSLDALDTFVAGRTKVPSHDEEVAIPIEDRPLSDTPTYTNTNTLLLLSFVATIANDASPMRASHFVGRPTTTPPLFVAASGVGEVVVMLMDGSK